jgi:16S rRNA (guanine527-N7)-methyltransferase
VSRVEKSRPEPWSAVTAVAEQLRLDLPAGFIPRARRFLQEVARWNPVARLTGYRDESAQVRHLVIESIVLLAICREPVSPVLDIGSGAGVPGLLLKLARPEWHVGLVEANRRRANFLRHAIRTLELTTITVHAMRAEALAASPDMAGRFRTVTLRAVAAPVSAIGLARPFLHADGCIVIPLGPRGRGVTPGTVREVALPPGGGLPAARRFLIIRAAEIKPGVSRETPGGRAAHPGHRQPEGRRGEDDDRCEPGRGPGRSRAHHPPG